MTTGLWAALSGLPADAVLAAIPPACRRTTDTAGGWVEGGEAIVETPAWPTTGATQFIPSFSALTEAPFSLRLELSARVGGAWSPWVGSVGLGPAAFTPLADAPTLGVDVDVFRASAPVEAVRLRARVRAPAPAAVVGAPWLLALSAAAGTVPVTAARASAARLAVPALSQMESAAAIAHRICSPTCVAMVLDFWRRPIAPAALAAEMFHPGSDLYGVWPAAILAAARRGIAGYLLRFPDWPSAAWCLEHGLPVIASIRYAAGELTGAAVNATSGHLVVLTGIDGDDVVVNDPAAPTAATVARRYRVAEFAQVWLERTGVGYVLFPPRR
ncbi:MAG TPA: C39 family peptidase [Methylomirabilota bacterium]